MTPENTVIERDPVDLVEKREKLKEFVASKKSRARTIPGMLMKLLLLVSLVLSLASPAKAMTEQEAVTIVVDTLRMRLQQTEHYESWDVEFEGWWTIYDVNGQSFVLWAESRKNLYYP